MIGNVVSVLVITVILVFNYIRISVKVMLLKSITLVRIVACVLLSLTIHSDFFVYLGRFLPVVAPWANVWGSQGSSDAAPPRSPKGSPRVHLRVHPKIPPRVSPRAFPKAPPRVPP